MKKTAVLLVLLAGISGLFALDLENWPIGSYMEGVMATMSATGDAVLAQHSDFGYKEGISFLGAYMGEKQSATWSFNVKSGVQYIIFGQGDQDVADLDIFITDSKSKAIAEDSEVDNSPVVVFTAKETGTYNLELELFDSSGVGSFCGVAILQQGGWQIPADNVLAAITKSLMFADAMVGQGLTIDYFNLPGSWCVYGGAVEQGKDLGITGLNLGSSNLIAFASGDDNSQDTDLALLSSDGKKTLAEDTDVSEVSAIQYVTDAKARYRIKMLNQASDSPIFIATSLFVYSN